MFAGRLRLDGRIRPDYTWARMRLIRRCAAWARACSSGAICTMVFALGWLARAANAGADEPVASYIFPAGGQRGTEIVVRVGGLYLHRGCPFEVLGPGVQAEGSLTPTETIWFEGPLLYIPASQQAEDYPKDYLGRIRIDDTAPLGLRYWRLWTSQGATPSRKFVVGDLPELVEQEIDGRPIPVQVSLPVTINGRTFPREDVDLWTFHALAGEVLWAEVHALRIGSPLEAHLEILGPDGRLVAEGLAAGGMDPFVAFTAAADGIYTVRIRDINTGGLQHYVYRLTLSNKPRVQSTYPLGGRRGNALELSLSGVGLGVGAAQLLCPAGDQGAHLSGPLQQWHDLRVGDAALRVLLEVDELPEWLEREPNERADEVDAVAGPCVLNGRIGQPGDADVWRLACRQGETWELDLRAARLGSPLDSVLAVCDETGSELASNDDLATGQSDSFVRFTAPADGTYLMRVYERFSGRGGETFCYRLRVTPPPAPDYELVLQTDALTVPRGGQGKLKVECRRLGGFDGPVSLEVQGLPAGVTTSNTEIATGAGHTELVFSADTKAAIGASRIAIRGKGIAGERELLRQAALPAERGESSPQDVLLAVAMPTPFKVVGRYELRYAAQGTIERRRYRIERNGYDGPLEVRLADHQMRHLQGVTGPTVLVPPESSECVYPVYLPPWMELGRTSRTCVMAVGEIVDHDGTRHVVSFTSTAQNEQIVAILSPGLLAVSVDPASASVRPGAATPVRVRVRRARSELGPVRIELVLPRHLRGVSAVPLLLEADASEGTLHLDVAEGAGPFNMPVTVRAATLADEPVTAEAKLELVPEIGVN